MWTSHCGIRNHSSAPRLGDQVTLYSCGERSFRNSFLKRHTTSCFAFSNVQIKDCSLHRPDRRWTVAHLAVKCADCSLSLRLSLKDIQSESFRMVALESLPQMGSNLRFICTLDPIERIKRCTSHAHDQHGHRKLRGFRSHPHAPG